MNETCARAREDFLKNLGLAVHYRLTQGHFLKNRVKIQFCDDGIKIAGFFSKRKIVQRMQKTPFIKH